MVAGVEKLVPEGAAVASVFMDSTAILAHTRRSNGDLYDFFRLDRLELR
ncbi:MAG: hypothetical protein QGI46_08105 [Planctomycetota bacterium]|jgi:hypothetical protein|nr:hypothetical protein [Planctomycetota bacterium]